LRAEKQKEKGHVGHADDLMPLFVIMSIPTVPNGSPGVIFNHILKG